MPTVSAAPPFEGMPQVEGVEHRMVDLGGFRAHVAETGQGEPLLLLHGWPQHWYMWHGVIPLLAERFRLIVPDLRGFGWSEAPDTAYSPEVFARDGLELLDALGIERCGAIGHDWGGMAIQLMAFEQPRRLSALLVCNVPTLWPNVAPRAALAHGGKTWYAMLNALPFSGRALRSRVVRNVLRRGHGNDPFSNEELDSYTAPLGDPDRAHVTSRLYRYYQRLLVRSAAGGWRDQRLDLPALFLFGKRDRYVSWRLLRKDPKRAPAMRIELVEDAGHFIVNEKPDLVAQRAVELFG